jgi:hypothetical protein
MAEMGLTPTDRWHLLGKHSYYHAGSTHTHVNVLTLGDYTAANK